MRISDWSSDVCSSELFPEFHNFPGHWKDNELYSVITRFGFLGVAHNTEAVTEKEARSYNIYWDEKLKGKVGHFDWHLPNLGQISLLNGNKSPYDINEEDWSAVKERSEEQPSELQSLLSTSYAFFSLTKT